MNNKSLHPQGVRRGCKGLKPQQHTQHPQGVRRVLWAGTRPVPTRQQHTRGFTLIELLIAVVIVGILSAIAYPAYQNSVTQSRRADAQGALTQLSNAMERVFTQNNTYMPLAGGVPTAPTLGTGAATPPHIFPSQAPLDGATKYYNLSISAVAPTAITATTFTLRATPIAGTGQANDGIIELDHTGAKRWDTDNSGGFSATENNWKQ